MRRLATYLWTSPNTLLGVFLALPDLATRQHVRRVQGTLEIAGPWVRFLLRHGTLLKGGARAITFGHVVLAVSPAALEQTREHERIHVAQYERWGPLFIPAYLLASFIAWIRRKDPYRDNRFEQEAFAGGDRGTMHNGQELQTDK